MKSVEFTHKIKFALILILGLLLSIFVYKNKIKPTFERLQNIENLNNSSLSNVEDLDREIKNARSEKKRLEESMSMGQNVNFESYLLDNIANHNSKINVVKVSDIYNYSDDNTISTLHITLKNDYKTVLKLINHIENKLKYLNIISIDFSSKKVSFNSTKKNLYATLYLQNIKSK